MVGRLALNVLTAEHFLRAQGVCDREDAAAAQHAPGAAIAGEGHLGRDAVGMAVAGAVTDGWTTREKFAAVVETAALNEVEFSQYCRQRGLYGRWHAARDNADRSYLDLLRQLLASGPHTNTVC